MGLSRPWTRWTGDPREVTRSGSARAAYGCRTLSGRGRSTPAVRRLGSDGGVVAVSGVDDGLRRQLQELAADGVDDRREVRVRASGCAGSSCKERVTGEHDAQIRDMETTGAESVTRGVQDVDVQSADGEHIPVSQLAVGTDRIDRVPQDPIGRMQV